MGKAKKNKISGCIRYDPVHSQSTENCDSKVSVRNKNKSKLLKDDEVSTRY